MADHESMKGKFQILDRFIKFLQICGPQPEIKAGSKLRGFWYSDIR